MPRGARASNKETAILQTSKRTEEEARLAFLESKFASYFSYAQKLVAAIPEKQDTVQIESFLSKSLHVIGLRSEFMTLADEINSLSMRLIEEFEPEFETVWSFTEMCSSIQSARERFLSMKQIDKPEIGHDTKRKENYFKLPRISLAPFSGNNLADWPLFIQNFNILIHENEHLSDTERIQYLLSVLVGKAKNICHGITPTPENYLPLYNALIAKYQDNRALASAFLDQLLELKPISNATSKSLEYFVDKFTSVYQALGQLKICDLKEFMFVHIGLKKLDSDTVKSFENGHRKAGDMPTYDEFVTFLREQVKVLERTSKTESKSTQIQSHSKLQGGSKITHSFVTTGNKLSKTVTCAFCSKSNHVHLYQCADFKKLVAKDRYAFIKSNHACINCLSLSHSSYTCNSQNVCKTCHKKHHTLLHFDALPGDGNSLASNELNFNASHSNSTALCNVVPPSNDNNSHVTNDTVTLTSHSRSKTLKAISPMNNVLLSTAQVFARTNNNPRKLIRCLIDCASQHNLISITCCEQLNLSITPLNNSVIKGVGMSSRPIRGYATLTIESRIHPHTYNIQVLVIDCITDNLPAQYIDSSHMTQLNKMPLADSHWNVPGQIDLVLGAQLFPFLLLDGPIDTPTNAPSLLKTTLGHVIMGQIPITAPEQQHDFTSTTYCALNNNDLQECLQKFWELEEVPTTRFYSPRETACENDFIKNMSRESDGRYTVALPLTGDEHNLGNSRGVAHKRLIYLERKFKLNPDFRKAYNEVIDEYIKNRYLVEVPPELDNDQGYFIPHHAVIKPDKRTTKVRIVLDASAKTHSGLSLNDVLYPGPNLQADLFKLLLNFRLFPVAITADIRQMYLQIGVIKEHHQYQRILFRFDSNESIRSFKFTRVPFGLKCSPFLAMRTVKQLAADERYRYPDAAWMAESEFYMDDLVSSVLNTEEAVKLSHQLIALFTAGGFDLVKWASNSLELLSTLPLSSCTPVNFTDGSNQKILGLSWDPRNDAFYFQTAEISTASCTKRIILSCVARLFDILGLVSPVILYAKLLIKDLWNANLGWDDVPPKHITEYYFKLVSELPLLKNAVIPRHLKVANDCTVNIVAFCDASLKAFGCAVYLHVTDSDGHILIRLACSKSRVSPIKIVTLARLELCAAVLLSTLVRNVYDIYNSRYPIENLYAFSDSTIALSWIHSSPHRWSTFVANRVAKVQSNLDPKHFYHIAGIENPSDCLSRGMLPSQLLSHDLWWNGPSWMSLPPHMWPIKQFSASPNEEIPELCSRNLAIIVPELPVLYERAQAVSSWSKLLRIIVYVLRFCKIVKLSLRIDADDLNVAEQYLIHALQLVQFSELMESLKKGTVPLYIRNLNPFLDEVGLIRVGGRLSRSGLPFAACHPLLLRKRDHIINLLIDHYHRINCHTGANLLNSLIKQKYWIISARDIIRSRIRLCNFCFRVNPTHPTPMMADLPSCRVQQAKAFTHTGVDYAGPINITLSRRRGQRSQKAYLCIFVCLTTKAVHIELVSNLSTETFLDAFKRFLSRRGPVSCMYSDNGTNFIGAKSKLNEIYDLITSSKFQTALNLEFNNRRISWKMSPPQAPHFGGIWESTVKSFKTHLYRIVGGHLLTYEELLTVLIQIEALLNSRPLCVLSEDPYPEVLTPAHFLMQTPLQYLPAYDMSKEHLTVRDRKRLLDSLVQSFWRKWRIEYLHTLQVRKKWCTPDNPVTVGTVVILMQDGVRPLSWPLGIIEEVYPGADGVIRVALVKTRTTKLKRPVVKLCPIPNQ